MPLPVALPVLVVPNVILGYGALAPHRDWVKGLNAGHALWKARQTYPHTRVFADDSLRWVEVTLSECKYGCKIMREDTTGVGYREIYHSTIYGCPLGREPWSTYESDQHRTHTPGGTCVYCGDPALIRRDHGWICSMSCV